MKTSTVAAAAAAETQQQHHHHHHHYKVMDVRCFESEFVASRLTSDTRNGALPACLRACPSVCY